MLTLPATTVDYFLAGLESFMRRSGQDTHWGVTVLKLEGKPDADLLARVWEQIHAHHPMLGARLKRVWRGWRLARSRSLRLLHLLTIGFVVLQSWLGQTCPLTLWESALRVQAGGQGYQRGLIEDWVGRCLFYNAPPTVFVLIYSGFAALVIWTWWRWPPRRRSGK